MRRYRDLRAATIVMMVIVSVALVPSCRRTPEEPPQDEVVTPEIELTVIDLPQQNMEIGITLDAAPNGLVATYNGEHWIELVDESTPDLKYTFVVPSSDSPGITPPDVAGFGDLIGRMPEGTLGESGVIETVFGSANWVSGTYMLDGELLEDVRVFAPHPTGPGTLVLYAVGPKGSASIEDRLATMSDLLTHVS